MLVLLLACAPDYAVQPLAHCLDFEHDLDDIGVEGDLAYMDDGAIVRRVREGGDFSALLGEEDLDLPGEHSLLLRSSHLGVVGTTARVELQVPPGATSLRFLQLSETEGVELVLADEAGWVELPVHTGGFVPALRDEHGPIPAHPEVVHGLPIPGAFVPVEVPVFGPTLEFTQTTLSEGDGFFTLIDEVCWRFGAR